MSYSISISGHADDETAEQQIIAALTADLAVPEFAATVDSAQGFFQFAGTVNLLGTAPVDDPKQDLDVAVTDLDDLLAEKLVPGTDGTITLTSDDVTAITTASADVAAAVTAYEASVSSALASAEGNSTSSGNGSSTASDGSATSGESTSPTGTGTADAPTLSTGEAVAL